jgi:Undecaprenyl-phosphate glucose phosphotransferase
MTIPHEPHRPTVSRPPKVATVPLTLSAFGPLTFAIDVIGILLAALATGILYHRYVLDSWFDTEAIAAVGAWVALFFCGIMELRRRYTPERLLSRLGALRDVAFAWIATFALLFAFAFLMKSGAMLSRVSVLSFFVVGFVLVAGTHVALATFMRAALRDGRLRGRKVLLIGDVATLTRTEVLADLARHGYRIADFMAARFDGTDDPALPGTIAEAARTHDVQEILVYSDWSLRARAEGLIRELAVIPLPVGFLMEPAVAQLLKRPKLDIGSTVAVEMQRAPLSFTERAIKRSMDIVIAGSALVILSPLLLFVALLVRLTSPGPAIFRQSRHGFGRRRFDIYKFRSMRVMETDGDVTQATRNDPRVTPFGRIIRRTSIDELPQLLNVLKGDMSIVGPRPHAVLHDDIYGRQLDDYAFRHHVKPGLTGWAQVNGYRGETKDLDQMRRRVEHDLWYIDNWSPMLDVTIIARTFLVLLFQRNAY